MGEAREWRGGSKTYVNLYGMSRAPYRRARGSYLVTPSPSDEIASEDVPGYHKVWYSAAVV